MGHLRKCEAYLALCKTSNQIKTKQTCRMQINPFFHSVSLCSVSLNCDIFFRLQVMPGFITSILQYESSVLLNCDISHKILRSDTVLDILYEMFQRSGERFYDDAIKKFVGSIVLTRFVV